MKHAQELRRFSRLKLPSSAARTRERYELPEDHVRDEEEPEDHCRDKEAPSQMGDEDSPP